jgi:hypothetical protein
LENPFLLSVILFYDTGSAAACAFRFARYSRAYHRNYSKEYRAKNLEKRREYERIKAREYRAKRKAQAAALPVS